MKNKLKWSGQLKRRRASLQHTLIGVFAISWLIPIGVFSYFIFHTYQNAYITKSDNLIANEVSLSGVLVSTDLDEAIAKIQKPTYEGEWEKLYNSLEKGNISLSDYLTSIRASLIYKFYMDRQVSRYAFYREGDTTPSCYSGKNGYSYSDYLEHVQPVAERMMQEDSNYVTVKIIDNQIYLIRNLYTVNSYRKYGTLVVGLTRESLFDNLPVEHARDVRIYINDDTAFLTRAEQTGEPVKEKEDVYRDLIAHKESSLLDYSMMGSMKDRYAGYAYDYQCDNYKLHMYYLVEEESLYSGIARLNTLMCITLICMLPIICATWIYLRMHIEKPLIMLADVSEKIKEGAFGSTVNAEKMPNEEFFSLSESFNDMSKRIKHLFDTVYLEKMATKDAQIAALQAQINPHFLNNTLEMMNWQARMNGDIEVCKMIEALGTVLDSSMNRSNDTLVRLSDELRCGDAFLYIMSMRFGQRLKIVKNIDEDLLHIPVPQLILQPLIENAIRHGIEIVNSGTIWVNIYAQEDKMLIDVINTGKKLTEQEQMRIRDIVSGKYRLDKSEPGIHTSMGIYNVNRRITLIYGPDFGLCISQQAENCVLSRITLPLSYIPHLPHDVKKEVNENVFL